MGADVLLPDLFHAEGTGLGQLSFSAYAPCQSSAPAEGRPRRPHPGSPYEVNDYDCLSLLVGGVFLGEHSFIHSFHGVSILSLFLPPLWLPAPFLLLLSWAKMYVQFISFARNTLSSTNPSPSSLPFPTTSCNPIWKPSVVAKQLCHQELSTSRLSLWARNGTPSPPPGGASPSDPCSHFSLARRSLGSFPAQSYQAPFFQPANGAICFLVIHHSIIAGRAFPGHRRDPTRRAAAALRLGPGRPQPLFLFPRPFCRARPRSRRPAFAFIIRLVKRYFSVIPRSLVLRAVLRSLVAAAAAGSC